MTKTFFDYLTRGARERVLRNLSTDRCSPYWQISVQAADQFSSIDPPHPLSEVAQSTFSEFFASYSSQFLQYATLAGETLITLALPFDEPDSPVINDALLLALRERCTAPRCLDIRSISDITFAERILKETSGRLRELKAEGCRAPAIEMYGHGLEELQLW